MSDANDIEGCLTHGPWGDHSKGKTWTYVPEGFMIRKISVRHGGVVDSIKFQSFNSKGQTQASFFGGKGGNRTDTICVDYPNEYLVSVSGKIGSYDGSTVVKSICFKTNENCYGPYGTNDGTGFTYDGKGGVIVGFHGCVGKYLGAIGVYVMPESLAFGRISAYEAKITQELRSSMSRLAMPRNAGPWGADGGKPWDDGVFSAIKQVRVHLGELNVIYAIQFEYVTKSSTSVWSPIHGGNAGGSRIEHVNLDGGDEFLTGVSWFFGTVKGYNGLEAIASISFHNNKRIHGPYGEEKGAGYRSYGSTAYPGKVVGFHGRSNGFLSKLGVHMEYF